nr:MAG TPA: hypothetical protein [Caudoviricetes sp.]
MSIITNTRWDGQGISMPFRKKRSPLFTAGSAYQLSLSPSQVPACRCR